MKKNLTTREASDFLKERGLQIEPSTLSYWRSKRMGPEFKKVCGAVYYERADLERFEAGQKFNTQDPRAVQCS